MRIYPLNGSETVYSCTSYLVLGDWNRIEDVNTLIDTGSDGSIVHEIARSSTGFGKIPVEQVVLTHEHFDHAGGLALVRKLYRPKVYALKKLEGVDEVLEDGQVLRIGDRDFQVLHTPGHSQNSLCLYCAAEKVLFSGDTTLQIRNDGGSYSVGYARSLETLASLEIETIYPGHAGPLTEAGPIIQETLTHVRKSVLTTGKEAIT